MITVPAVEQGRPGVCASGPKHVSRAAGARPANPRYARHHHQLVNKPETRYAIPASATRGLPQPGQAVTRAPRAGSAASPPKMTIRVDASAAIWQLDAWLSGRIRRRGASGSPQHVDEAMASPAAAYGRWTQAPPRTR
eukprot:scaffold2674_cov333-Prasinococcus_capsulatus_cf.AAC.9